MTVKPCRILQATAIGDAAGAGYEFVAPEQTANYRLEDGFREHPLHTEVKPGMFTDDTMFSVAAARALIHDFQDINLTYGFVGTSPANGLTLANEMVALHRDHPTKGYSRHVLEGLDSAKVGADFRDFFLRTFRSDSNGAAMRSACYGVMRNLDDTREVAALYAELTHSGAGVSGAVAIASASHYFHRLGGDQAGLKPWLDRYFPLASWTIPYRGRVDKHGGPLGLITTQAALTIVCESKSLTEVIERSIRIGGDVDTVAAIAMGLAVSCADITDDLPTEYWTTAIQPVAGLTWDTIVDLDEQLGTLFQPRG